MLPCTFLDDQSPSEPIVLAAKVGSLGMSKLTRHDVERQRGVLDISTFVAGEIQKLANLRDKSLLTDAESDAQKLKLL